MMKAEDLHVSVMQDRLVEVLAPALSADGSRYVDCTLGMGGHAEAVLTACPAAGVIGLDRDPHARRLAGERLQVFGDRVTIEKAVFDELPDVLTELGIDTVDAVFADLGVSSLQLDDDDRGFAYSRPAPLDMRMSAGEGPTAADVLNTWEEAELARILKEYGEEKFARKIASNIVAARQQEPFAHSQQIVDIIERSIPARAKATGGHPAKRTFQALRIAVNDELGVLHRLLPAAADALRVGGRLAIMSFQSLEDRIVKEFMARATTSSAPRGLPVELPEHAPVFKAITRGAEKASEEERLQNPRAASVRFRVMEKVRLGDVPATTKGERR